MACWLLTLVYINTSTKFDIWVLWFETNKEFLAFPFCFSPRSLKNKLYDPQHFNPSLPWVNQLKWPCTRQRLYSTATEHCGLRLAIIEKEEMLSNSFCKVIYPGGPKWAMGYTKLYHLLTVSLILFSSFTEICWSLESFLNNLVKRTKTCSSQWYLKISWFLTKKSLT